MPLDKSVERLQPGLRQSCQTGGEWHRLRDSRKLGLAYREFYLQIMLQNGVYIVIDGHRHTTTAQAEIHQGDLLRTGAKHFDPTLSLHNKSPCSSRDLLLTEK